MRLLLLSKSKDFPNGLSNNHGQVGRHYIAHWDGRESLGLFPADLNIWYGANAQAVVVNNWADDNFDHAELGFIGGASMTMGHEVHPIAAATMPTFERARPHGARNGKRSLIKTPVGGQGFTRNVPRCRMKTPGSISIPK